MTKRQKEELAKLYMDLGKLTFGSLVVSIFQTNPDPVLTIVIAIIGLIMSVFFFRMGLKIFGELR